eukprot:CFRG1400T1
MRKYKTRDEVMKILGEKGLKESTEGHLVSFVGHRAVQWQCNVIKNCQTNYRIPGVSFFSLIGSGPVVLLMSIIARWMMEDDIGWRLSFVSSSMLCLNGLAKAYLRGPRPYWMDADIKTLDPTLETSFGFPSGHVMGMFAIWGILAWHIGGTFTCVLWVVSTALVAYSRVYTGAHFIHDVVGGALLGGFLMGVDILNEMYILKTGQRGSLIEALILFTLSAVAFKGVLVLAGDANGRIKLAMVYEGVSGAGFAFGLGLCHVTEYLNPLGCVEDPPMPTHLFLLGVVMIFALNKCGKQLVEDEDGTRDLFSLALHALVIAGIMFWSTYVWPRLAFQCPL